MVRLTEYVAAVRVKIPSGTLSQITKTTHMSGEDEGLFCFSVKFRNTSCLQDEKKD